MVIHIQAPQRNANGGDDTVKMKDNERLSTGCMHWRVRCCCCIIAAALMNAGRACTLHCRGRPCNWMGDGVHASDRDDEARPAPQGLPPTGNVPTDIVDVKPYCRVIC